ncbi:MAG: hypothetical protein ACJAR2_003925 [Ilumatobacter sp.]
MARVDTDTVAVVTGPVWVSLSDGAVVGEIGFLNGDTRTATITTDSNVVLQVLTPRPISASGSHSAAW